MQDKEIEQDTKMEEVTAFDSKPKLVTILWSLNMYGWC